MASSIESGPSGAEKVKGNRADLVIVLAFAVLARVLCWSQRPPDMGIFLEPWFAHIVRYGPVEAFAHPFSNYEPAYLYLLALGSLVHEWATPIAIIKTLSVAGTAFMALGVAALLKAFGVRQRGALLVAALPSVIIDDALLAQCDALWAGACIFALASMVRGRTLAAMLWCGLAISFKAQAAFIAPVMIGAMIGRRAPLWHWAMPAAVFLATLVPPWLLGWPGAKLLTVYLDQAAFDKIPGRLANPWMIGTIYADHASRDWFFLGYVAAGATAVVIAAFAVRSARNPLLLLVLAALAATALPFLLPKMLERYYFLGDVLTVALALVTKRSAATFAAVAIQTASVLTHISYIYFFYEPYPTLVGAVFAAAGIVALLAMTAPGAAGWTAELRRMLADRRASKHPHVEAAGGRVTAG